MSEPERIPAPIDPQQAREHLQIAARESPLVRQAFEARRVLGWSEADTLAMLAYHALDCLAKAQQQIMAVAMTTVHARIPPLSRDQVNLASMIDKTASEIALGRFGDVAGCAIFLVGTESHAVVTLPQEDAHITAVKLRRAAEWCETGVLPV